MLKTTLLTLLAAAALAAPAHAVPVPELEGEDQPGRSEQHGHPVALGTVEQDCVEINSIRIANRAGVAAALPEGWTPTSTAARIQVLWVDYACEAFSIDDLPARRTIVSWLVAPGRNATTGERRLWTLAHGSDNPLFVQRLRKLGVDSRYLPESTLTTTALGDGRVRVDAAYVDDREGPGLDYVRTYEAPEPSAARTAAPGGVFWFDGAGGPVRIGFQNEISEGTRAVPTETYAPDSLPRALGIVDVFRSLTPAYTFYRGSWTASLTRQAG